MLDMSYSLLMMLKGKNINFWNSKQKPRPEGETTVYERESVTTLNNFPFGC